MSSDQRQRLFDILVALLALALLSPLLITIAIVLLIVQGGPLIYRETRIGLRGKPFTIYKFRTMLPRANRIASVAPSDDPNLTAIGRHLKPTRLDELPQLVNVLRGDMSLVGPRPLPPSHLETLTPAIRQTLLTVRPGITSPASIQFIAEDDILAEKPDAEQTYLEAILPAKTALQIDCLGDWTLGRDLTVLFDTLILAWSPAIWRRSRDRIRALVAEQGQ